MQIAFLLYDRFAALDVVGPFEVFANMPGIDTVLVAEQPGPVNNENGACQLVAQAALEDVTAPDIVVVPGGTPPPSLLTHEPILDWLREVHGRTQLTTSVCTGALLLGAAGLLDGVRATTHWAARDKLADLGADVVAERVVTEGKIVTAAGVSAGIDMAFTVLARTHGDAAAQAVQLGLEYDPQPPFDSGAKEKAFADTVALVTAVLEARAAEVAQAA